MSNLPFKLKYQQTVQLDLMLLESDENEVPTPVEIPIKGSLTLNELFAYQDALKSNENVDDDERNYRIQKIICELMIRRSFPNFSITMEEFYELPLSTIGSLIDLFLNERSEWGRKNKEESSEDSDTSPLAGQRSSGN